MEKERKRLQEILDKELEEKSVKKPITTTVRYGKEHMDKYLNNKETVDLLNFYGLKLPIEYKDKSLEEFQEAFDKGLNATANYKKSIKDVRYVFSFSKSWRKCKRKNKRTYQRT